MPALVWKCLYCTTFDLTREKVREHEVKCKFNPANKVCFSCEFHKQGFGAVLQCTKGNDDLDVLDGIIKCEDYSEEKQG